MALEQGFCLFQCIGKIHSTDPSGRSGIPASVEVVHGSSSPPTHIGCSEFSLLVSVSESWWPITRQHHDVAQGWTASFVSPLYAFDSCTPTILEVLVFWLISAMGNPGGFAVPEISSELVHRRQLLVATPRDISRDEPAEALAVLAV